MKTISIHLTSSQRRFDPISPHLRDCRFWTTRPVGKFTRLDLPGIANNFRMHGQFAATGNLNCNCSNKLATILIYWV